MADPTVDERRQILIVAKTYPNVRESHQEAVSCVGVDLATRRWIRLHPMTTGQLAGREFTKYQVIECAASPFDSGGRPDDVHIDHDTIRLIGLPIPAKELGWRRRMALLPAASGSLEEINGAQVRYQTSLGMFRPRTINRLVIDPVQSSVGRPLVAPDHARPEPGTDVTHAPGVQRTPWTFSYEFDCRTRRCSGHTIQILDWEIADSYWRAEKETPARWEEIIRRRYERELPDRDVHFVVSNSASDPREFLIIGLVRPPRRPPPRAFVQATLKLR